MDGANERALIHELVELSSEDPLAPFVLRPEKSYVFSDDRRAVIGYRDSLGLMVASGDPVGDRLSWPDAVTAFVTLARQRGRGFAVLGAGEGSQQLWALHGLRSLCIGRDVVVRPDDFALVGRSYRNLRQAIQRTRNAGVSVRHYTEARVPDDVRRDLAALLADGGRERARGFSMILGIPFDGIAPDSVIGVARDRTGRLVGAHRYLRAGAKDLSLDVPVRARAATNGVDERIIAETVGWAAEHGYARVSLAFAPFPDLFGPDGTRTPTRRALRRLAHGFDPLIKVERLYRYLRKFHAFDQQRFVMLRWSQVIRVATALLRLEFFG